MLVFASSLLLAAAVVTVGEPSFRCSQLSVEFVEAATRVSSPSDLYQALGLEIDKGDREALKYGFEQLSGPRDTSSSIDLEKYFSARGKLVCISQSFLEAPLYKYLLGGWLHQSQRQVSDFLAELVADDFDSEDQFVESFNAYYAAVATSMVLSKIMFAGKPPSCHVVDFRSSYFLQHAMSPTLLGYRVSSLPLVRCSNAYWTYDVLSANWIVIDDALYKDIAEGIDDDMSDISSAEFLDVVKPVQ